MNINKKSFKLTNRIGKTFSLYMANFQSATTLIFRIIQQIDVDFIMSILVGIFTTMRVKRIRLFISVMKLIAKITQTINSKYIKVIYTIRERMKFVTLIHFLHPITFISKAIQKVVTVINQGKLHITATAVYAVFNLLVTFDPQTLGTLDPQTLGTMDYTLV